MSKFVHVRIVEDLEKELPICHAIRHQVFDPITKELDEKLQLSIQETGSDITENRNEEEVVDKLKDDRPRVNDGRDGLCKAHFLAYVIENQDSKASSHFINDAGEHGCVKYIGTVRLFEEEAEIERIKMKIARISQLAVLEEYRKIYGVGGLLMTHCERYTVEKLGLDILQFRAFGPSIGFYEKIGYENVGERFWKGDVELQLMRKRLT